MTAPLPDGWRRARIQELGAVLAGRQRSPNQPGTPRPYLRVANVLDGTIDTSDVLEMPFTDSEYERFRLLPGDVLVNEGQSRDLVGRSAVYRGGLADCCFQNTIIRFRADREADSEFAHQLFAWLQRVGRFSEIATQTTSIAHLGVNRFARFVVQVPGLREQREIAATLKAVDDAIAAGEAVVEQLGRVQRDLVEVLVGSSTSARARVSEVAEVAYGLTVNGQRRAAPRSAPFLAVANLTAPGEFDLSEVKTVGTLEKDERYQVRRGDVLVVEGNANPQRVGVAAVWQGQLPLVLHQNHLLRIRPAAGALLPEWLAYSLAARPCRAQIEAAAKTSSGLHTINSRVLGSIELPLPGIAEQRAGIQILDAVAARLDRERHVVVERRRVKAALADELLSGRLRVRDAT